MTPNPEFDPELERDLRAALRRAQPPRDLLPAIEAQLAAASRSPRPAPRRWAAFVALAAVLVLALAVGAVWRQRQQQLRQQRARAAAIELTHALRLAAADLQRVQARLHAANE